jgi:hypothetical protein
VEELACNSGARGEGVEAVLVALQRLVQQTYELALALAQTATQVAECLKGLPIKPHIIVWRKLAFEVSLNFPVCGLMTWFDWASVAISPNRFGLTYDAGCGSSHR